MCGFIIYYPQCAVIKINIKRKKKKKKNEKIIVYITEA